MSQYRYQSEQSRKDDRLVVAVVVANNILSKSCKDDTMVNTYTQIHIHFVFAVKHSARNIQYRWKNDLYKYTELLEGFEVGYDEKYLFKELV